MRGGFTDQGGLFSYIAPDKRVPANHPLRKVRELVRDVLSDLNRSLGRLYASEGRPSARGAGRRKLPQISGDLPKAGSQRRVRRIETSLSQQGPVGRTRRRKLP